MHQDMRLAPLLEGLLDALAPPRCAACDDVLGPGAAGFCDACAPLLEPAPGELPRAALLYGGPLADALRRFKYGGRSELASVLAPLLLDEASAVARDVSAVVPVPLHARRERERGFNQSALLARPIARMFGLPFAPGALRRVRHTPPQASLDMKRRLSNVRAAFRAVGPAPKRVLLIDDVRTTGSTLAECARALRAGGAARVYSLVLARVES